MNRIAEPADACGGRYTAAEPYEPVETVDGAADGGLLLLCDHATNLFPPGYGTLGVPESQLQRHIAYDIGVAGVTRGLAARLGAPAVLTRFSRLFIDPNRGDDDPTLIMQLSDGAVVPGNHRIDAAERARRVALCYRPYHDAVAARIDAMIAAGRPPMLFAVHSFTPVWRGTPRVWHVGILWDRDPRMAQPMMAALAREAGLVVGDNEPYVGALRGDTMHRHGTERGLAHALIEIRQDLIGDEAGIGEWVDRLTPILEEMRALPDINEVTHFGSRTDRNHGSQST